MKRFGDKVIQFHGKRVQLMSMAHVSKLCLFKKRYGSSRQAVSKAKKMVDAGAGKFTVYDCPICNGAHLTSQNKGK